MEKKELIIHIQLEEYDNPENIFGLLLSVFNGSINMRHAVKKAFVDDLEVYGDKGFSKEFFNVNS